MATTDLELYFSAALAIERMGGVLFVPDKKMQKQFMKEGRINAVIVDRQEAIGLRAFMIHTYRSGSPQSYCLSRFRGSKGGEDLYGSYMTKRGLCDAMSLMYDLSVNMNRS